jgi:hypothetical protein
MKCPGCGLVNFSAEAACRRCGIALAVDSAMPIQNLTQVWRDSTLLVISGNSELPRRCLRCNADSGILLRIVKINYYPSYNLVTWWLIGDLQGKEFTLHLPLCKKHNSSRWTSVISGILIIFSGLGVIVTGIGYSLSILYYLGFILFISGFIVVAIKGSPISVEKFDEFHIWLKGISEDYLSSLPQWKR